MKRLLIGAAAGVLVAGVLAVVPWANAATTTLEAESAQLSGGAAKETEHGGYSGSGYVGGFTDANKGNASASFALSGATAGSNTVTFRYANGTGSARTMSLTGQRQYPPVHPAGHGELEHLGDHDPGGHADRRQQHHRGQVRQQRLGQPQPGHHRRQTG